MKFLLPSTFILFCTFSIAQPSLIEQLHDMQKNPRLKEKVYVHTNKTSYFVEDTIWFKAYVGDTINYPSLETTRLYVNLLDSSGTVIYGKNLFVDEGIGQGEFELNSAVSPGKYYIQAYTNYMRNFGKNNQYLQEITVLGERVTIDKIGDIKYDIQLFPEGGHLLEAIENVMGVKAMINGRGADFSGEIIDSNGEPVASFTNEHLGMTRCKFQYEAGESYAAKISINDTVLKLDVPKALQKGMALHIDNSDDTYVTVSLKTNEATFSDAFYSDYSILCHQKNQIIDLLSVTRLDSVTGTAKMSKKKFLEGVNTVTLFENERPIAERKFFVEKDHRLVSTQLDRLNVEKDSIRYKLRLSCQNLPVEANLSISVLSENTKVYAEKQHLRSTFLLTSLLKGTIEDPVYYFDTKNPSRKEHLDLLLLTQGWSQYTLKGMMSELRPHPKFEFEYGFELNGELEGPVLHDRLALIADDYQVIDTASIKSDRQFRFSNLLLYKGDTVKVSYLNGSGKIIKPDTLRFDDATEQSIPIPKLNPQGARSKSLTNERSQIGPPLKYEEGTIALEGVILTDKKLSQHMIERRALIKKFKPMVPDIGQYYNRSVPENFKESDLMSFLRNTEGIRTVNAKGVRSYLVAPGDKEAFLFIDGRRIDSYELPSVSTTMTDIENVMVAPTMKLPFVVKERFTFIQVFTKNSYRNNTIPIFNEHIVTEGYDQKKKYCTPLYDFDTNRYADWIEVDWKPVIKTDEKGVVFIKVPSSESGQNYLFSIQGFSENGHLISKLLTDTQ